MTTGELSTVDGTVFIVTNTLGNVVEGGSQGLFAADTRHLSRYELRIPVADLIPLRAGKIDERASVVFATNTGRAKLPPHGLEVHRVRDIGAVFHECVTLTNRADSAIEVPLTLVFDADFADIFEVRASLGVRTHRSTSKWSDDGVLLLSDRRRSRDRKTWIGLAPAPDSVFRRMARYSITLEPRETWKLDVTISWQTPRPETKRPIPVSRTMAEKESVKAWQHQTPVLETEDLDLVAAYGQAIDDLADLEIALDVGYPIPAAGLPWYLAIFGRDSIITSIQCLLTGRRQAIGTLRTLAEYQSREFDEFRDAEPGKIAHEIRFGELAVSDEIPHGRYYGTVDATPLWLILLGAVAEWETDDRFLREMLPTARTALEWIDNHADLDGDGLVEYQRRSRHGLENQGWKDSWDSSRFADGRIAEGPIALVEVQGYVYAARMAMASVFNRIGEEDAARKQQEAAEQLKRRLHEAFWMPEAGYYALALDGAKQQVDSITSNPGHLLWCDAIEEPYAGMVAERLLRPDMYSGWGVRTMSSEMRAYNPLSYHNGSVWPHDNSLILAGMARYGYRAEAMRLINALLDAAAHFERNRLPELFCGYDRDQAPFPVDYPVACSPQAWASGSVILMLQTMLGISALDDALASSPLAHGRDIRLSGVTFRGQRYTLDGERGLSSPLPESGPG